MRLFYKLFYVFLILIGWVLTCRAQAGYDFTHLDNTNGLSNNSVTDIFQDSDKLLWISTNDGLNVYNGNSFQLFRNYDPQSSFSLPDNSIIKVLGDKKKQIWICTEKGVTCYNKEDGSINHFFYNSKQGQAAGSVDNFLTISNDGTIVAGLRLDSVLYIYNDQKRAFQLIKFDSGNFGMIAEVAFDNLGRLWTLNIGGQLTVFARQGQNFHRITSFKDGAGIHLFYATKNDFFFTTGSHFLYRITPDLQLKQLARLPRLISSIQSFQGHYLVSYIYKGLQEFDGNFKPVDNIIKYCPQLNNLEISLLFASDDKVLWVSTTGHGLYKLISNKNSFGTVKTDPAGNAINSSVTGFLKVDHKLWVITKSSGVFEYNPFGKTFQSGATANPINAFYDQTFNSYYAIKQGYDGNIYIGSDAYGLTVYDPVFKKFTTWEMINGTKHDQHFFRIFSILPCPDSSVYVGYLHGLTHLKIKRAPDGKFSLLYLDKYKNSQRFLNIGNNAISSVLQKGDWILVGYQYAGLVLLNTVTRKSISILNQSHKGSLSSNNITSLYLDRYSRLWIGTDFGLNRIKFDNLFESSPQFQKLDLQNGLPDDMIHAIVEANDHTIWVSTNRGLAKINPVTLKVIQYRSQDGLQNDEFTDGAVWKDETGNLYFGGISGFNHFDPAKIPVDENLPNLLISNLSFGSETSSGIRLTVIKPVGNYNPQNYDLPREDNFFHLRVEPANGFANFKFQLKYKLTGFDDQWRELNENNRIEYTNIPAGNYDFLVKWSNGQGGWTPEKHVFHVHIAPYVFWSITAQIIYVVILLIAIYSIYIFRKNRLEIKSKLYIENLIRVKEQKLYEEKVNFFTNITHELQTPLTLILGAIERFFHQTKVAQKKNNEFKFLRIANQEAFRLQYLVHQLLEFRKAESGHSKVTLNTFNASNLIRNIAELFGPLKEQKNIELSLTIDPDIFVCSDKDKFEKIIFNLFSNAFKHSASNDQIKCRVNLVDGKSLQLTIANSGFEPGGIELSSLFEQFYTIDHNKNNKESSGIGLALTKQLTEILGGAVTVTTENEWIIFHLQLPAMAENKIDIAAKDVPITSDKPSYLVRSIVESMEITEDTANKNNDLALIENLEKPGKKSVLIVEDELNIRLLLKEILQDEYVVYEAQNGDNAIQLLQKIIPNLILSDVLMADMDGLTLCTMVKNNIETCHIPFLLLSARGSAEHKLEGFEAGADGYMTKPYSPTGLLRKIKGLIDYNENIQLFLNKEHYYNTVNHSGLKAEDQAFLNNVINVINNNISAIDLDASLLEKQLSMSRMSLYRKLKTLTNMTPSEFIKHIRIRYAASLLTTTNLTVSEIYFQTGFNNQSYFYREFKKAFQASPKEFREQNQINA